MTTIVGIDHSLSRTGIAIIRAGEQPELISVASTGKATDGRSARGQRMRAMRTQIMNQVPRDTTLVGFEGLAFGKNQPGQDRLHHLWWLISDACDHLRVPVVVLPPTTVKKWATDNGHAGKDLMRAAMSSMWPGLSIPNDDTADALACATIVCQQLGLPLHYLVLDRHKLALSKIQWPQVQR